MTSLNTYNSSHRGNFHRSFSTTGCGSVSLMNVELQLIKVMIQDVPTPGSSCSEPWPFESGGP